MCRSWKQHQQYLFPDPRDGGRAAEEDSLGTTFERLGKIIRTFVLRFQTLSNPSLDVFIIPAFALRNWAATRPFILLKAAFFSFSWAAFGCLGTTFLFVRQGSVVSFCRKTIRSEH